MPTTFKDIYNQSLSRVSEDTASPDAEGLVVVKNAINEGYLLLRTTTDKRSKILEVEVDTLINLPEDYLEMNKIDHDSLGELNKLAYSIENGQLFILSRDIDSGTLSLNYVYIPPKLVGDNDTLTLKAHLEGPLAAFGAYAYMVTKKKYASAQMLQQEFMQFINIDSNGQTSVK